MKIITWNINGFRSTEKDKNFQKLIAKYQPDIVCLQELKMNEEIPDCNGYSCFYHFAHKKGYSGTLILTKEKPLSVRYLLDLHPFDEEGRFLMLEYDKYYVINLYIPHGGRNKEKHPYKFAAINQVLDLIKKLDKEVILCTDFNIAHQEIDLKNYKNNYHNNMFSFEERAKIDELLNLGLVDSFRYKTNVGNIYSMWPNGFHARERNIGWRIDYIFVSKEISPFIQNVTYLNHVYGSDHCPCLLELSK